MILSSRIKQLIIFIILAVIYFSLRLGWADTIEFGYDQPRIALTVMEVLEKRDFLNVIEYIKPSNFEIGTLTYGAFFIYFLAPFFLISRNPIIISCLIASFNFLGIIFTYLIGKKLFNQKVGFFAGFFMVVFPWSVIFSRMIYNPTLLLTFVPLIIYITILIVKDKKDWFLLILPTLWTIILQFHLLSLCIVATSFLYLIINFKKKYTLKFIVGFLLGLILWVPLFRYELKNNFLYTKRYLEAPFTYKVLKQEANKDKLTISKHFFKILSGQDLEFQLGYAYQDFLDSLPSWFYIYQNISSVFLLVSFIFLIVRLIIKRKKGEFFIFLWVVSCPALIYLLYLEVVPRYFLMILPAEGILIGLFIDKVSKFIFKRYSGLLFSSLIFIIVFANSFFMIKYYNFIFHFNYPKDGWMGWLSRDSDPPFSFIYQAFNFCLKDAKQNNFNNIIISNDPNIFNRFQMSSVQEYTWRYVFNKSFKAQIDSSTYFVLRGLAPIFVSVEKVVRFGPYSVYLKD